MKKVLLLSLCLLVCAIAVLLWPRPAASRKVMTQASAATRGVPATNIVTSPTTVAAVAPSQPLSRERDLSVNPYAAGLHESGKSKREWDANFIQTFQQAQIGHPVRFELTKGIMAEGLVKIVQREDGKVTYVSGELTAPETGKFFFLTPPVGGKAGKAVGVIEFPGSKTAYRVEPTGANGEPELWERRLDEVICMNMAEADPALLQSAAEATNKTEDIVPLRPDQGADFVPSYNANIVSLQSYPGSPAVLLLDFAGGYTASWGGVTYARPPINNATIKDIWKRIAEDFMPFNINVTTDFKVFQAAPAASRQRCCFTTTPITPAGVAYFGSWNWGNDTVCWSVYYVGKSAAEVGAHEPGHTLGLAHQTQLVPNVSTNEYYGGQGSGETGWAPIMGVGYYQPLSTWAKGEYQYANQQQDELQVITTANNNVTYRTDDTGNTLATSRYLEVYTSNTVFAEGVIERTDDTDAFQFTTTGGAVSLTVRPVAVNDWADLATMATLADATDVVIASNNVQSQISSTITTNLSAGTYTFRVTGVGKNDPLSNGFSSYASLGYYFVTGSVAGARLPTRLTVLDHATNNTVVGTVPANNPNSSPLIYTINSGNTGGTFSVDNNGVVLVANNALLDYYKFVTNTSRYAPQFEVFMDIANVNNPALTELNRRVVITVQKFYPPVPIALTATVNTGLRVDLSWVGGPDAASYNVKRSTTHLGPYTTIATPTVMNYTDGGLSNGVTYYYVVSSVNTNAESANSAEASVMAQSVAGFGFEFPNIGSGNFSYNPAGGFWKFSPQAGNSGSGIVANGSGFSNPNAPEGTQAAFVQSYGSVSQTLSGFTPGNSYTITYSAAQRSGQSQNGGETWSVLIDGNVIKTNAPGSTAFTTYTALFTATATTHTLTFQGTDLIGGDNTVFIDNVRFSPVLLPVPAAVAISSPANGSVIAPSAPVNITVTVTTNGNLINGVQFYTDNITLLGQITNAPYTFAWANVGGGAHTVFARVLFNNGSTADSLPVTFTVLNRNLNLSFEIPSIGSGYAYGPAGAAWTFSDSASGNGSGIAGNGSAFGNPNAPQGTQAALLQSYGSISQMLHGFTPGTNYTISYSAAQRSGVDQHGGESWDVAIDGVVIKTNAPGSTAYTNYTANFTATATTHTLAFVGTDLAGGDNTLFLDNVTFNPPLAPSLAPDVITNTLPATAADVVGNSATFAAGFSSASPLSYQWQKIVGGLQSEIPGATNTSLTLNNLQLSDAAAYRLQASNAYGIAVSIASSLVVSNVPAAVSNNVVLSFAAQTGLGSVITNFTPTWTVDPGSLLLGQSPSSVGSGDFAQNTGLLTEGTFGYLSYVPGVGQSSTEVTAGSSRGQSVTYTLSTAASGYVISNIVVYGGWGDAGRDQQAYTVSYSTVANPNSFIALAGVNYNPDNPNAVQSATRVTLSPASGGVLASSVAALKFDFTTPSPENGYCGYSEIAVYGSSVEPALVQNTLPVTATDVVGGQVTFTAAFTGAGLSYQWRKVSGGVTNDVSGATNTILMLNNLQLGNAGSYLLQVSNNLGVLASSARTLTVNSLPVAVNNVIAALAAQTGTGSNTFAPTWSVASSNNLIGGKSPSSTTGNFSLEVSSRSVDSLTDGSDGSLTKINGNNGTTTSTDFVTCGNGGGAGSLITYTLAGSATGYTLTNIVVYGGWADAGRDQQAYTVSYSKVASPATFTTLGTVNYNPSNGAGAQSATRATLIPANGVLATNVAAVRFNFSTPTSENGYCGYSEIALFGVPTQTVAVNPTNLLAQVSGNNLNLSWPDDHIGWRLQVQTNSLGQGLSTNWFDISASTGTNQISIPINTTDGSVFYRLRY